MESTIKLYPYPSVSEFEENLLGFESFHKPNHLTFDQTVLSDHIERELARYYSLSNGKSPLLLDFRNALYIDIVALMNCIATVVQRKEWGAMTYFAFPLDKKVRDFLDVWRFAEAVSTASGSPFEELLLPQDHAYLGEGQAAYRGIGDAIDALEYNPDWNGGGDTKRNFFEFTSFLSQAGRTISPEGPFFSVPRIESKRWAGELIKQVLKKHLGGDTPKDDVARVIVYETMSNAIRHPNARVVQAVSHFARRQTSGNGSTTINSSDNDGPLKKIAGSLRLCVWDDGESIYKTLKAPLDANKTVRAFKLPVYMCERIYVQKRDFFEQSKETSVVDQSVDPTRESREDEILLSSLHPGVSRTVQDDVPKTELPDDGAPNVTTSDVVFSNLNWSPGMGLYALTRTALDQYQGTLVIRSGNYRLTMEVAHDAFRKQYNVRYKCKITGYPANYPQFKGNLITVQLPIKAA